MAGERDIAPVACGVGARIAHMDAALPPIEVTVRCGRCVADLGLASPAMAVLRRSARGDQWQGQWRIKLLVHIGRGSRAAGQKLEAALGDRLGGTLTGYRTDGRGQRRPLPGRADRQRLPRGGRGLELACRRCRYRPPVSRRDVYQQVDRAAAAGRCDVYLD
jgi:hypothetical protein